MASSNYVYSKNTCNHVFSEVNHHDQEEDLNQPHQELGIILQMAETEQNILLKNTTQKVLVLNLKMKSMSEGIGLIRKNVDCSCQIWNFKKKVKKTHYNPLKPNPFP